MPDMYHVGYITTMDRRKVLNGSNAPIGFPRPEIVYAIADNELSLHGPPIEINHPPEYNSMDYRCDNESQTMKYGVAGVKNITSGSWITSYIEDVDEFGMTIKFSTGVNKGDKCIIYYYARPSVQGGMNITPLQDEWIPEVSDILVRKMNDSLPSRFGSVSGDQANTFQFTADMIYNTGSSVPDSGSSMTFLIRNDPVTGTFRNSDYPIYITEIIIKFTEPGTWPDELAVCVIIDDSIMTKNFSDTKTAIVENGMVYIDFDPDQYPESAGPYTNTPGNMKSGGANETQFFFDLYRDNNDKVVIRIPYYGQCNESISVLMGQFNAGASITGVDCYVRGWYHA